MRTLFFLLVSLLLVMVTAAGVDAAPFHRGWIRHASVTRQTSKVRRTLRGSFRPSQIPKTRKTIQYRSRFAFLRRVVQLAVDPAHGRMTPNSKREGIIGVTLEARGRLPGPIVREPTGKSEFVDATGTMWDVKGFNSHFPGKQGGFILERAAAKILGQFRGGENVILDTKNLSSHDEKLLRREVVRRGWSKRVIWFR
ncbi:MAG: hypothetical protein KAI47_17550 [Deltaproteobacteria bacterium]|nr:hypothetical protein [Deltaproteobacteria bacterium]